MAISYEVIYGSHLSTGCNICCCRCCWTPAVKGLANCEEKKIRLDRLTKAIAMSYKNFIIYNVMINRKTNCWKIHNTFFVIHIVLFYSKNIKSKLQLFRLVYVPHKCNRNTFCVLSVSVSQKTLKTNMRKSLILYFITWSSTSVMHLYSWNGKIPLEILNLFASAGES